MEKILRRYNPWWEESYRVPGIRRSEYLSRMEELEGTRDVIFIVGVRRVGKTTLMKQYIEAMLSRYPRERILYFSMDHPSLSRVSILDVLDEYRIIQDLRHTEKFTVFIDEVHLHPDFERELKTVYDMGKVKVYASGSASIFLYQKGAHLTGRQRFIEVYPFSFNEYLDIRELNVRGGDEHLLLRYAEEYVKDGGLPEYVLTGDPEYITTLVDSIVYKDVADRYSIKNTGMLKDLLLLLCQSIGGRPSTRKIAKILGISHETVREYLYHFQETYLVMLLERHGKGSIRKGSPKKIYLVDSGMANILTPTVNFGSLVENTVYNNLRTGGDVKYAIVDGKEVDFIVGDSAYEVKYMDRIMPEKIYHMQNLNRIERKIVITRNYKSEFEGIKFVPLYIFLSERY